MAGSIDTHPLGAWDGSLFLTHHNQALSRLRFQSSHPSPAPQTLYLLLVTNKGSNILEDLETLRLLAKLVPEYVPSLDEEGVSAAAFELLFAFDEVRCNPSLLVSNI